MWGDYYGFTWVMMLLSSSGVGSSPLSTRRSFSMLPGELIYLLEFYNQEFLTKAIVYIILFIYQENTLRETRSELLIEQAEILIDVCR